MIKRSIAYYRVSTQKQGASGLGLEAQRDAVRTFLGHTPDHEFIEIESGKRHENRPQLQAALIHAELTGSRLIVAKLDRLSRNAAFLMTLKDSGVDFVCADNPHANRLTIGVLALVAQEEAEAISARTKAALKAAQARGVKLGGDRHGIGRYALSGALASAERRSAMARDRAAKVLPIVRAAQAGGVVSIRDLANYLNERGILSPRGKGWSGATVRRLLTA